MLPLQDVGGDLTRWATSEIPRVATGFSFFDSRTGGGIAPGEMLIMLARSGVGKTWYGLNVIANSPTVPTLFFSIEMHARYGLKRLAGVYTNTPTGKIESDLKHEGRSGAVETTIEDFPLLAIDDSPDMSTSGMLDTVDDFHDRFGVPPKLVVVDFLELIRTFGATKSETVVAIAQGLKAFARETDTALIVLHQVSRGEWIRDKGQPPVRNIGQLPLTMADGNYGGETLADYMMGMYRPGLDPRLPPEERQETDVRLQFLKTRADFGTHPDGVQHHWNPETGKISEVRW